MTVQKSVSYNVLDSGGQTLTDKETITLCVLEKSGNYLIHKDVLHIKQIYDKVRFQQKHEVKLGVVDGNLGVKKELDVHVQVQIVHLYGKVVVLFLVQNLELLIIKLIEKNVELPFKHYYIVNEIKCY